jgi:hypothetical protein
LTSISVFKEKKRFFRNPFLSWRCLDSLGLISNLKHQLTLLVGCLICTGQTLTLQLPPLAFYRNISVPKHIKFCKKLQ